MSRRRARRWSSPGATRSAARLQPAASPPKQHQCVGQARRRASHAAAVRSCRPPEAHVGEMRGSTRGRGEIKARRGRRRSAAATRSGIAPPAGSRARSSTAGSLTVSSSSACSHPAASLAEVRRRTMPSLPPTPAMAPWRRSFRIHPAFDRVGGVRAGRPWSKCGWPAAPAGPPGQPACALAASRNAMPRVHQGPEPTRLRSDASAHDRASANGPDGLTPAGPIGRTPQPATRYCKGPALSG